MSLLLSDPARRPSFLRAALAIAEENGVQLQGSEWGQYSYNSPDDRPADVKVFYDLLQNDNGGEPTAHFIQQLGLLNSVTLPDMQRLSREKPGTRTDSSLKAFQSDYPVIFDALAAVFLMMPSNSRIAEQKHGGLRYGLKDRISLRSTDATEAYISNEEYYARAVRRNDVLARKKTPGKGNNQKGSVAHDKEKLEQNKCGKQLLESGAKYKPGEIAKLPAAAKKAFSVRNIQSRGVMDQDEEVKRLKALNAEKKYARRRNKETLTLEQWKAKAKATVVANDTSWIGPEERERRELLEKIAGPTFWNNVKAKEIHQLASKVLPHIKLSATETQKNKCLPLIKAHLLLVRGIASKTERNSITQADLSRFLDRSGVLQTFIDLSKANSYLCGMQAESKQSYKLRATLLGSCGVGINKSYFTSTLLDTLAPDEEEECDDEDEEEEEELYYYYDSGEED
jgi:hypothetical protein